MPEGESGHEVLALEAVLVALSQQDADAEETPDAEHDLRGLLVVIGFCGEDFGEGFGGGDDQAFGVEDAEVADYAIIGDASNPMVCQRDGEGGEGEGGEGEGGRDHSR